MYRLSVWLEITIYRLCDALGSHLLRWPVSKSMKLAGRILNRYRAFWTSKLGQLICTHTNRYTYFGDKKTDKSKLVYPNQYCLLCRKEFYGNS